MKNGPAAIPYRTTKIIKFVWLNDVYHSAKRRAAESTVDIHIRLNLGGTQCFMSGETHFTPIQMNNQTV